MTESRNDIERDTESSDAKEQPRRIPADDLFRGDREIWIEHEGTRYRLRITRRNKLILQK